MIAGNSNVVINTIPVGDAPNRLAFIDSTNRILVSSATIEVEDGSGRTASVVLSDYGAVRRPLDTYVLRRSDLEATRFQTHWELILQTYSIPLLDFEEANAALDVSRLTTVRFLFDRVHAGEIVFDQVGFSALDPAFLGARVDGN